MILICWWHRRRLVRKVVRGEPITQGSSLSRHLGACAACAMARRDLTALREALPASLSAPSISEDFSAKLQARLRTAVETQPTAPCGSLNVRRGFDWRYAFGAAVGAATFGLAFWVLFARNRPVAIGITGGPVPPGHGAARNRQARLHELKALNEPQRIGSAAAGALNAFPKRIRTGHQGLRHRDGRRVAHRERRHRAHAWRNRLLASGAPHRSRSRVETVPGAPGLPAYTVGAVQDATGLAILTRSAARAWSDAGEDCEALGDFSRASAAYARACETEPDADLAIAAATNAECAGDMAQALEYCALALRPAERGAEQTGSTTKKGGIE
jgi:hypothetical protein